MGLLMQRSHEVSPGRIPSAFSNLPMIKKEGGLLVLFLGLGISLLQKCFCLHP